MFSKSGFEPLDMTPSAYDTVRMYPSDANIWKSVLRNYYFVWLGMYLSCKLELLTREFTPCFDWPFLYIKWSCLPNIIPYEYIWILIFLSCCVFFRKWEISQTFMTCYKTFRRHCDMMIMYRWQIYVLILYG